jgi:uncharacterized protein YaaQ
MENTPIKHLMTVVVQEQDVDLAVRALAAEGMHAFHLASSGGFLGRRNATLLVGLPEGRQNDARSALQKSCRQRVEYLAIPLEGSPLPLPTPVPVTVGGATIFTLPVERYEEF